MKQIPDFPEHLVTEDGRVFKTNYRNTGKVGELSQSPDKDGYPQVSLWVNNKGLTRRVHGLVAKAHIPNPENKPQVNHINGIKHDNRVCNLEWCTPSENRQHAFDTGLQHGPVGEKAHSSKLTETQVLEIRRRYSEGGVTQQQLGEEFGVKQRAISKIILRQRWAHI